MYFRHLSLIAIAFGLFNGASAAGTWPERTVTLVVPFPAGGTVDTSGRAVSLALSRIWRQPVVVENRGGAGGTIGAAQVARAAPDGYTLLIGTPADQVNAPFLLSKLPYDPARDLVPVGCLSRGINALVVNPKLGVKSVAELIASAKAQPGKLHYGSAGNGNTSHLSGELFAQSANIELMHVPYRGNAPALTDTIAGQVEMMFSAPGSIRMHVQNGKLRMLAVTSSKRVASYPDTPTFKELGLPVEVYAWSCVFAPSKTSPRLIADISAALSKALDDPEVERNILEGEAEKYRQTPEEAQLFLASERKKWGDLIRGRNIKAD